MLWYKETEREGEEEREREQDLSYLIKSGLLASDGCVTRHKARQERGRKKRRKAKKREQMQLMIPCREQK